MVAGGDLAGLLDVFAALQAKTRARTGHSSSWLVSFAAKSRSRPGPTSAASRGMVRPPSSEKEDPRIKGLLLAQGISKYEPLRRDRRARLAALRTGDGRELPAHLKAQISRELDRLELLLEQLKALEAERDDLTRIIRWVTAKSATRLSSCGGRSVLNQGY